MKRDPLYLIRKLFSSYYQAKKRASTHARQKDRQTDNMKRLHLFRLLALRSQAQTPYSI